MAMKMKLSLEITRTKNNLKEVKFRPNTAQADYERKLNQIRKFIEKDEHRNCKVTIMYKGRERANKSTEIFDRLAKDLHYEAKVQDTSRDSTTVQGFTGKQKFVKRLEGE